MTAEGGPVGDSERQPIVHGALKQEHASLFKQWRTVIIIAYYAFCSSTMLLFNKLAIYHLPAPTYVLYAQLLFAAVGIKALSLTSALDPIELEWGKVKAFFGVACFFLLTLFTNIKVLQHCNVETFITFRSSTPLVLSVLDYFFLGRQLPNLRSWICLTVLVIGSLGYAQVDSSFSVEGYSYVAAWYAAFCVDMIYIKFVTDSVKMTNWARAFYQNLLAMVPLTLWLVFCNEHSVVQNTAWTPAVVLPLLFSCALGIAMSHASYMTREAISATSFTIVGILCKILTVVINVFMWDKHASPPGLAFLSLCILAGTFYQQAPLREPPSSPSHTK